MAADRDFDKVCSRQTDFIVMARSSRRREGGDDALISFLPCLEQKSEHMLRIALEDVYNRRENIDDRRGVSSSSFPGGCKNSERTRYVL